MDRTTASYYRSILFNDAASQHAIPASLVALHNFAFKRCQAFGLSIITKLVALQVVMDWVQVTAEGRAFAANDPDLSVVFAAPNTDIGDDEENEDSEEAPTSEALRPAVYCAQWQSVEAGSKVVVKVGDQELPGEFETINGAWLKVRLAGESNVKAFRPSQVQLASV